MLRSFHLHRECGVTQNEEVNEIEPGYDIAYTSQGKSVETDDVNSDGKAISCNWKDNLVTELSQDFNALTAKKKECYVSEKHPLAKKWNMMDSSLG